MHACMHAHTHTHTQTHKGTEDLVSEVKTVRIGRMPGSWPWQSHRQAVPVNHCAGGKAKFEIISLQYGTGY